MDPHSHHQTESSASLASGWRQPLAEHKSQSHIGSHRPPANALKTLDGVHLPPPPMPATYLASLHESAPLQDKTNMQHLAILKTPQSMPRDGASGGWDSNAGLGKPQMPQIARSETTWPPLPTLTVHQTQGGPLMMSPGQSPMFPNGLHLHSSAMSQTPTRFEPQQFRAAQEMTAMSRFSGSFVDVTPSESQGSKVSQEQTAADWDQESMPSLVDDGGKPPYSYAMLIGMAILRSPERKLTLAQIYSWINDSFSWYKSSPSGWQNSIRHNLSLNKAFVKQGRPKSDPGKGNYWVVAPGFEKQFLKPPTKRRPPHQTSMPSTTPSTSADEDIGLGQTGTAVASASTHTVRPSHLSSNHGVSRNDRGPTISVLTPSRPSSAQSSRDINPEKLEGRFHSDAAVVRRTERPSRVTILHAPSRALERLGTGRTKSPDTEAERSPTRGDSTPPSMRRRSHLEVSMSSEDSRATLSQSPGPEPGDEQSIRDVDGDIGSALKRPRNSDNSEPRKRLIAEVPALDTPPTAWLPHLVDGYGTMSWDGPATGELLGPAAFSGGQQSSSFRSPTAVATPPRRDYLVQGIVLDSSNRLFGSPHSSLRNHRAFIRAMTTPSLEMQTLMTSPETRVRDEAELKFFGDLRDDGSPEKLSSQRLLFGRETEFAGNEHVAEVLDSSGSLRRPMEPMALPPIPTLITPIRRPFDTPIRDQRYAFSPYKQSPGCSGSPRR